MEQGEKYNLSVPMWYIRHQNKFYRTHFNLQLWYKQLPLQYACLICVIGPATTLAVMPIIMLFSYNMNMIMKEYCIGYDLQIVFFSQYEPLYEIVFYFLSLQSFCSVCWFPFSCILLTVIFLTIYDNLDRLQCVNNTQFGYMSRIYL